MSGHTIVLSQKRFVEEWWEQINVLDKVCNDFDLKLRLIAMQISIGLISDAKFNLFKIPTPTLCFDPGFFITIVP